MTPLVLEESPRYLKLLSRIAVEVAAGMHTEDEIPDAFNIPHQEWQRIRGTEDWERAYLRAYSEVGGSDNSLKRIRMKAALAVEDSIPTIYGIIHDVDATSTARMEAFKQLATVAGADPRSNQHAAATGSGFAVTINIGGGEEVTISGSYTASNIADDLPHQDARPDVAFNNDLIEGVAEEVE